MRIGIITYQRGHRKTLEVVLKLMSQGAGHHITLFAFPFKQRLRVNKYDYGQRYRDRPHQLLDYDVADFCNRYGVGYTEVPSWDDKDVWRLEDCSVFLHCTSKIIPASFIQRRTILNVHPGLLPTNRGVDAFKRSIVNGWPVGVTLHAIDETIDGGTILFRRVVPILNTDTLAHVCQRMYDFEVDVLANFQQHIGNIWRGWKVGNEHAVSHERIHPTNDAELETIFESRKEMLSNIPQSSHVETYPDYPGYEEIDDEKTPINTDLGFTLREEYCEECHGPCLRRPRHGEFNI